MVLTVAVSAQTETLTNDDVILLTQAGLGKDLIIKKISETTGDYRVSTRDLIELKKAGLDDEVIKLMMEKAVTDAPKTDPQAPDKDFTFSSGGVQNFSESTERIVLSPKEALEKARTVAIQKSSVYPSRQALEKALLKRPDWRKYDLNIVRLKEDADLYIEIGRIPLTLLSRRYVFRVYDRRSGTVLTAGETTSWGDLAGNLAREITQKLNRIE